MKCSLLLALWGGAMATAVWAQSSNDELDRMIAAGKSQKQLAQFLFDTHGCDRCHTLGHDGKLGFTKKGEERAQGFQGCISTLKAMSIIAKVPENQRSATQAKGTAVRRVRLFNLPQDHARQHGADRRRR